MARPDVILVMTYVKEWSQNMNQVNQGWPKSARRLRGRLGRPAALLAAALVAGTGVAIAPAATALAVPTSLCADATTTLFGPNVCVFTPSMSQDAIQADLNAIAIQQVPLSAQFNSNRYAIFFEPGTYGTAAVPLVFQVGYYEQVAGLGAMPQDVVINGQVDAMANALDCASATNCWYNSTVNFWRSLSNLQLNVVANAYPPGPPNYQPPLPEVGPPLNLGVGVNYCAWSSDFWSVSQAAPLRRLLVNGNITFQQYCTQTGYGGNDFASGGFIADSQVNGDLNFYGQQQYLTRNSSITAANGCPNGLWNMVYSGVIGAPTPMFSGSCQQNTVVATSPTTEEQPFLYTDSTGSNWSAFVPAVQHNTSGTSWASGNEAGTSAGLSSFFIANPSTPLSQINGALGQGHNLLLTPGIYNLSGSIVVPHPDTVIMGLGFATLVPQQGTAALTVVPNTGVKVSGLIIDAGPVNSPVLMSVGTPGVGKGKNANTAADPDLMSDVFFRIGGAEMTATSATVSLVDNAPNSIIDDLWAWRADHGANTSVTGPGGQVGAGWTYNTGDTGVAVTGDNVTAYGLAVEHYQKNEVVWSGNGGQVIFFQNELPYDPPSQSAWEASPTQLGYPAFQVTPNVTTFNGYGMGSYVVFIYTPAAALYDTSAFQSPTAPGVHFTDTLGVWISGPGGIQNIINHDGVQDTSTNPGTVIPVDVPSGP